MSEPSYDRVCITSEENECSSVLLVCLTQYGNLRTHTKMLMAVEPGVSLMDCCCCFQFPTLTVSICSAWNIHFMFIIRKGKKLKMNISNRKVGFPQHKLGFWWDGTYVTGDIFISKGHLGSCVFYCTLSQSGMAGHMLNSALVAATSEPHCHLCNSQPPWTHLSYMDCCDPGCSGGTLEWVTPQGL